MKNVLEEASCFRCQDMALASACQLFGFPIVAIDRQAGNKSAVFIIERKEGLDNLIEAFWTRELRVDPLSYWEHCRSVKNRLYKDIQ